MTMREPLLQSMQLPEDTVRRIHEFGATIADEDSMSKAIHDVYCGIIADHHEPNEKDRDQARKMIAALKKHTGSPAGA